MARTSSTKLWDLPTRLFHWSLVLLVLIAWVTAEMDRMPLHHACGYATLSLLIFRVYWGIVGSTSARFCSFVKSPRSTLSYLRTLGDRKPSASMGHNPLGAWSVLAILGSLGAIVTSGLLAVDVDGLDSGPLSELVSFDIGRLLASLHHKAFAGLELLVVLHLAAICFYWLYKRQNLVHPMISGTVTENADGPVIWIAPAWRAFVGLALSALLVWLLASGLIFHVWAPGGAK